MITLISGEGDGNDRSGAGSIDVGRETGLSKFVQDGMSEGHRKAYCAVEDQCRANHFIMTVRFLRRNLDLMIACRASSTASGDSAVMIFVLSRRG